jgi:hypothetical protein
LHTEVASLTIALHRRPVADNMINRHILSHVLHAGRGFESESLCTEQVALGLADLRDVRLSWVGEVAGKDHVRSSDVRPAPDSNVCKRAN